MQRYMRYINSITIPSEKDEIAYLTPGKFPGSICYTDPLTGLHHEKLNYDVNRLHCFTSVYPFNVLSKKHINKIDFSNVTILCGGNGCGKTTLLNVIAQKLGVTRTAMYNRTSFFEDYLLMCEIEENLTVEVTDWLQMSRIITSDDVFDYMFQVRDRNDRMDARRDQLRTRRNMDRPTHINFEDEQSIAKFQAISQAQKGSFAYVSKQYVGMNPREFSNGESGFQYFLEAIQPGGLYLLDEPENSLSAERQIELKSIIEAAARFDDCQFIISTHSPFISAINEARIYNMDTDPVCVCEWNDIPAVKTYLEFFENRKNG